MDENDILSTNTFIRAPELEGELRDSNEEFRKYYDMELSKKEEALMRSSADMSALSIRSVQLDESTDVNNILNTNLFDSKKKGELSMRERNKKEEIRLIHEIVIK